jgi:TRAP-type C4-dicarboxylate transport system substrate-binding protein
VKKLFLILLAIALVFSFGLIACTGEQEEEEEEEEEEPLEPIVLRYAANGVVGDKSYENFDLTLESEIETRTDGKIEIEVYPRGVLAASTEIYDAVKDGVADIGNFAHSWLPGRFPLTDVANLPFAVEDGRNLIKAMNVLQEEGYFDNEWDEVKLVGFAPTDAYVIFWKDLQPMTLEEFQGLKVRNPGGVLTGLLTALGCVPVPVTLEDAYMSWSTGVVDGWWHSPKAAWTLKLYEAGLQSILKWRSNVFNGQLIFNKEKWAEIPPDLQEILLDVFYDWQFVYYEVSLSDSADAQEIYDSAGAISYTLPASEMDKVYAEAEAIWDKFIDDNEAAGRPAGQLVADFITELEKLGESPWYEVP